MVSIDYINSGQANVTLRNIGSVVIQASEISVYAGGSVQTCTWTGASVAPGALISCDWSAGSCTANTLVRVTASGGADEDTC